MSIGERVADVRKIAVSVFEEVLNHKRALDEVFDRSPGLTDLSGRDRAFAFNLLLTAFRHLGTIDAVLGRFLEKPLPKKSGPAHTILRLAAAQLLFVGTPSHAAIDTAVTLAKSDRDATHFAGLVNAVLRKVAVEGPGILSGLDQHRVDTPAWLWDRWSNYYGPDAGRRIASAHHEKAAIDISVKRDAVAWAERLGGTALWNGSIRLPAEHAPLTELPGFETGDWWVQDVAATLPAALLGDVRGLKVLDLCSAPGGKTMQLSSGGAEVTAVDISGGRLKRLKENLVRTRLDAEIIEEDVFDLKPAENYDAVLLDAPCSATGTIRRHPELPYLRDERQLSKLSGLQRRMLKRAALFVRPGGRLVYCTCSLEPEEGEFQIRSFLDAQPSFTPERSGLTGVPEGAISPNGWIRTLPFMDFGGNIGCDGFFAALLRRES